MARRPRATNRRRHRRGGNPLTRPLTPKWIAGIIGGGFGALIIYGEAGRAYDFIGGPYLATRAYTDSKITDAKAEVLKLVNQVSRNVNKVSGQLDDNSDQLKVTSLQTQRVVIQNSLDRAKAERAGVDQTLQTIKDRTALDIMKRREAQIDDEVAGFVKQVADLDAAIGAAQNPSGRKRAQEHIGHGKSDDAEGEPK
jgi:hypothetical protein